MLPRFFVPALTAIDDVVPLPPDEAHHLRHVLRLGVGDTISVFDGRGREFVARVEGVVRQDVRVRPIEATDPARESSVALTLAPAVLRGRDFDAVVRDATALGVVAVHPLMTARTALRASTLRRGRVLERWRRIAVSTAKQCGRAVVPEVRAVADLDAFAGADGSQARVILVEPAAGRASAPRLGSLAGRRPPASLTLAIGPEGGWTAEEIDGLGRARFTPMTLGSRTLRAELVPAAALAVLLALWGEL